MCVVQATSVDHIWSEDCQPVCNLDLTVLNSVPLLTYLKKKKKGRKRKKKIPFKWLVYVMDPSGQCLHKNANSGTDLLFPGAEI